jgi:stage V sporulation protein K
MTYRDPEIEAELQRMKRELQFSQTDSQSENLEIVIQELNNLVGMQNVKYEVNTLQHFSPI